MSLVITLKDYYHRFLAWFGNVWYGAPSQQLCVIGITGTKGKSSTVELLSAVLKAGGYKVAALSSVRVVIGETIEKNTTGNTMPGRLFIQRFLRRAVLAGCTHAILEVTSQGVMQHRHEHIDFDIAGMTCLHPEHIEAHGSFKKYRQAKTDFFQYVAKRSKKFEQKLFINTDSPFGSYFEQAAEGGRVLWYSREEFLSAFFGANKENPFGGWFLSDFNLENAALAFAIAKELGIAPATIEQALKHFKGVPGRLELIQHHGKPLVVVDYAHTPESLAALYTFLKPRAERLICVLGSAGGGRDKWKRSKLGEMAAEYCDEIILTSEDPYDEDPLLIMDQIESGFSHVQSLQFRARGYAKIIDRKEAITEAIHRAKLKDVVAITGMGSQLWFHGPKGKKIPWNERQIAEEYLMKR